MDLTVRERRQKVADCIQANVKQTLATIAKATGFSKSSVHRHRQAIERCNQYPESSWWESRVGAAWLVRLVLAVVYHFGIKHGVGAESLSTFFHAIHVEMHVGSSPTALRQLKHRVSQSLIAYEAAHAQPCQPKTPQGICVGADETFFGLPILVLIELASGYIFTEVECANRTYSTWLEQLQQWWDQGQWQCHFLVSDGASALSKLALSGLGCAHVADLFHAMRSLGRPMGRVLGRQNAQLSQKHDTLQAQWSHTSDALKRQDLQERITTITEQQQQLADDQQTYHNALETISLTVHPFTLDTQQWQLADELATHLAQPLKTLSELAHAYGGERAAQAIATFQTHIPSLAQGIQAWWQWVTQALSTQTPDLERQNWVLMALLPWLYWLQQADKTRQTHLKGHYQQAASDAYDQLMDHPVTLQLDATELQQWVHWGQWISSKYQRTSSAVEGRNGYLSKLHHAGRGFSEQSLTVLTIIHNFDLKRSDGTTAAQRLFGHSFPDVFEWILTNINDLPMPRKSANTPQLQPLHGEPFSA